MSDLHPSLSAVSDRELVHRGRAGDRAARAALIVRYLPLARSVAVRYRNSTEPLDDLAQIAAVGLVKAVDRWDPERGLAFSSYAVPTITGELRHFLRDHTWLVRPIRRVQELAVAIEQTREPLRAALGREPTTDDLAERLECSARDISEAMANVDCRWGASLDREVLDANGAATTVGELTGAEDVEYERAETRVALEQITADLSPRAREALRLRFSQDLLQREIADRLGVSQMQVSRLVNRSIRQLRLAA